MAVTCATPLTEEVKMSLFTAHTSLPAEQPEHDRTVSTLCVLAGQYESVAVLNVVWGWR